MDEMINAYQILVRKREGHRPLREDTCGLLPQGGFTSSNQAVYGPFQGPYDMDLPSSQSAQSIEPRPASWQCI
jgi:hypothetical protein